MNPWIALAGATLIVVTAYDVFVTTVSATSPAGPLSQRLTALLWRLMRGLARSPQSRILAASGPVVVAALLLMWLVGLWLGWSLVFWSDPTAVVSADVGRPAEGFWANGYFAGFTVYTLGIGDLVPHGAPWRMLAAIATINGFVLLTMSVSYLIPVVMAVNERRALAIVLHGLGGTAQQVVTRAWDGASFARLSPHLRDLAPRVARAGQQYLSYPVLYLFHSTSRSSALEPAIVVLDEALFLLEQGIDPAVRPDVLSTRPLATALEGYASAAVVGFVTPSVRVPAPLDLEPLRRAGVPLVSNGEWAAAVDRRERHRRVLAGLLADAGWSSSQQQLRSQRGPEPDA